MTKTENLLSDVSTENKGTKMLKVMVADEISPEGIDLLEQALTVSYDPKITPEQLLEVADVGPIVALAIRTFFDQPHNREVVEQLRAAGVTWDENDGTAPG